MIKCPECGFDISVSGRMRIFGVHFAKPTDIKPCPASWLNIPDELRRSIVTSEKDEKETATILHTPTICALTAPEVFHTAHGTPYLKEPGISIISMPSFYPAAINSFIASFGFFDADDYVQDFFTEDKTHALEDGVALAKFAGQLCYMSFGEARTKNVDAAKYIDHILQSGHGSVLEHANYTLLFWGIDRSCTHEIVRHRAGFGFSQVSQRYVNGKTLRFVERPEYQQDAALHARFEKWIDSARQEYDERADALKALKIGEGLPATESRKARNQAARAALPNETEAPIVITGNVRAWRNFIEQRASVNAEPLIRNVALNTYKVLCVVSPLFFDDYKETIDSQGRRALVTAYRKV